MGLGVWEPAAGRARGAALCWRVTQPWLTRGSGSAPVVSICRVQQGLVGLPYPVLWLLKATSHNYFLHPSWTSSPWACLCVNEYWLPFLKCSSEKEKIPWEQKWETAGGILVPRPPPSSRRPDVSWWPVPGSPHSRLRGTPVFQNPLSSARQRYHLPVLTVGFKCHLPCLLGASRRQWIIAWLV